jgi:DNA-binding FadR family transcriptional regulator
MPVDPPVRKITRDWSKPGWFMKRKVVRQLDLCQVCFMALQSTIRVSPQTAASSRERLVADVIARIRRGELLPGQALPGEVELAGQYRLGRSSVREALARLKAMGLVVSRRGSGHYVGERPGTGRVADSLACYMDLQRDAGSFGELLVLRQLIECECAAMLARQSAGDGRERLRAALEAMRKFAGRPAEFARRDIQFHRILVETSGNRLFISVMDGCFQNLGERFAQKTYQLARARIPAVLQEHTAICEAVEAGRTPAARKATAIHLEQSRRNLERLLYSNHKME